MSNLAYNEAIEIRKGGWIQTYTGGRIFPLDPRLDEIHIEDIAHSLSLQCRYNGHVNRFYSVAEHSLYVSQAVAPANALSGLMHDASEAYLTDVPRPIKPSFTGYYGFEDKLMNMIAIKYGFTWPMPLEVKDCDNRILNDEKAQLLGKGEFEWEDDFGKALGITIKGLRPEIAEELFMDRFKELTNA